MGLVFTVTDITISDVGRRACPKCGRSDVGFHRNKARRDGLALYCKECVIASSKAYYRKNAGRVYITRRNYALTHPEMVARSRHKFTLKNYGLTLSDYEAMLESQGGACAICKASSPGGRHSVFCVDHDHSSGMVRGLLCMACNKAIGLLKDDPELLARASEYVSGK